MCVVRAFRGNYTPLCIFLCMVVTIILVTLYTDITLPPLNPYVVHARYQIRPGAREIPNVNMICPLSHRKRVLDEYCANHHPGKREEFINGGFATSRATGYLIVDDVHELLLCVPPKAGISAWRNFLGHAMTNWTGYDAEKTWAGRSLHAYSNEEIAFRLRNYLKVIVSRHPLDRLASAYNDKFVRSEYKIYLRPYIIDHIRHNITHIRLKSYKHFTHNHTDNILEEHAKHYEEYLTPGEEHSDGNPFRVHFSEFLQYLTSNETHSEDLHWRSVERTCSPCEVNYDIVLKTETMNEDAQLVIEKMKNVSTFGTEHSLSDKHSFRKEKEPTWRQIDTPGYVQTNIGYSLPSTSSDTRASHGGNLEIRQLPEYKDVPEPVIEEVLRSYWPDMVMFGYDFNIGQIAMSCSHTHGDGPCC